MEIISKQISIHTLLAYSLHKYIPSDLSRVTGEVCVRELQMLYKTGEEEEVPLLFRIPNPTILVGAGETSS